VRDPAGLVALCGKAREAAEAGFIVTLGVLPSEPATGYGYIRPGAPIAPDSQVRKLEAFIEKPDRARAEEYVASGFLWNSGNFIFRADIMQAEIARFEPTMAEAAEAAVAEARRDLDFLASGRRGFRARAEEIHRLRRDGKDRQGGGRPRRHRLVGRRLMERGAWDLSPQDESGNAVRGQGLVMDGHNVLVRSDAMLTTVVGVDDVIVVTTQDAVLVLGRQHGDKVKQLVERLKREGRREAGEHKRMFRPWGYYQSIDSGARYQVKRIVVKPGERCRCRAISIAPSTGSSFTARRK
jgi:mannose-1-phosphate guanylyltransferase/mannose-6-phosphate isomerase